MASICGSLSSLPIILALLIYLLANNKVEGDDPYGYDWDISGRLHERQQALGHVLKDHDWLTILNKIYSVEGEPLQPDETYSLLKQLDAIFEPFTDEQTNMEKSNVKELIEARECDGRFLLRQDLLAPKYWSYKLTLVPYLEDVIERFKYPCEEKLRSDLHSNVENMRPESRKDIETLTEILLQIYYGGDKIREDTRHISMEPSQLVQGILLFLERKNGDSFTRRESVDFLKFMELFNQQILELCDSWTDITEPIARYDDWGHNMEFDELEKRWLTSWRVCSRILWNGRLLTEKAFKKFKRETSKLSKASASLQRHVKKLNCFGQTSATC